MRRVGNLTVFILVSLGGDCKRYSLNNAGPCINGGKLTCKGDEVAHEIKCECPSNSRGAFCEEKIEKVNNDPFICVLGPSKHLDHLLLSCLLPTSLSHPVNLLCFVLQHIISKLLSIISHHVYWSLNNYFNLFKDDIYLEWKKATGDIVKTISDYCMV